MVLHTIEPQYRIDRTSLRDLVFAPATQRITWPQAVTECGTQNMQPAGAGQLWGFRLEADGADHANEYFQSSTAAIYFIADGRPQVAFYDTQGNGSDNPLIANAQTGYDAHRTQGKWHMPMKDARLRNMLKTAERNNRVITPGSRTLALSGQYANDPSTIAILGDKTLAADAQTWLRTRQYTTGYNWLLSADDLHNLGVNERVAELRRVGVGGGDYGDIYYLVADGRCVSVGRARGVRKNSTGNQG